MRSSRMIVSVSLLLVTASCAGMSPPAPQVIEPSSETEYQLTAFSNDYLDYKAAVAQQRFDEARMMRDQMTNRIRVDIESHYRQFESELYSGRAGANVAADFTELAMSGVTTVVGGEGVKAAIAAALTVFKGTRLSVDQNWFRERTTEALLSQMRASRDAKTVQIMAKTSELDVTRYPFEEAWTDLVELFYAGSLQSALIQIVQNAGNAAVDAAADRQELEQQRAPIFAATSAQISDVQKLRNRVIAIRTTNDVAAAQAILTKLAVAVPAGSNAIDVLDDYVAMLPLSPAKIPAAVAAFGL